MYNRSAHTNNLPANERRSSVALSGLCGLVLAALGLFAPATAWAQAQLMGPSMSLEDASSQFANPALMSFQRSRIALGAKAYHLGIGGTSGAPLRQGYAVGSTPFFLSDRFGVGAHVQYFDSPIFQRSAIGASVSARVLRFLSVGVRIEALNVSYNQNEFVGFDPADPVFANGFGKTVLTTSVGAFAQPLPNVRLSAGFRNLNRPNLSLGDDTFRQDIESFLGIGYGMGPAMALVEFVDTFNGLETRFGVEAVATSGSFVRLSSNTAFELGRLEGQLHVGGPISVHYGYELPFGNLGPSSNGSHTFSVVFDFGRTPDLPEPINIPSYLYSNSIPEVTPQLAPKVYISSSTDYVRFYEQQIVRKVNQDVPYEALQRLSREDLGMLDSTFVQEREEIAPEIIDEISGEVALQGSYSSLYEASIRELGRSLAADSARDLTITGPGSQLLKAAGMRNTLVNANDASKEQIKIAVPRNPDPQAADAPAAFVPREDLVLYEPDHTLLYLNSAALMQNIQSWELQIVEMEGTVVKTFAGTDVLPNSLSWDWRADDGQLISPGVYRYSLQWIDQLGNTHQSNERKLYVQKMLRKITIEVTRDIEAIRKEADAVEIRIQQ